MMPVATDEREGSVGAFGESGQAWITVLCAGGIRHIGGRADSGEPDGNRLPWWTGRRKHTWAD